MTTTMMDPISKTSRDSGSSPDSPSALLDHYLSLDYRIELVADEGAWVASNPDLPGCASFGPDPGAAVKNLADVRRLWLEGQIASGNKIPEPLGEERYSGKFVLRIPKSLHRLAEMRARQEGVSLNTLVTNVLAGSLNYGGQSSNIAAGTTHTHRDLWHRIFLSAGHAHDWSTVETETGSYDIWSGAGVFLDNVASQLSTHYRSVFNPSKECYHAAEKRLAQK